MGCREKCNAGFRSVRKVDPSDFHGPEQVMTQVGAVQVTTPFNAVSAWRSVGSDQAGLLLWGYSIAGLGGGNRKRWVSTAPSLRSMRSQYQNGSVATIGLVLLGIVL